MWVKRGSWVFPVSICVYPQFPIHSVLALSGFKLENQTLHALMKRFGGQLGTLHIGKLSGVEFARFPCYLHSAPSKAVAEASSKSENLK